MCTQTRTHTPPRALLASPKLTHRRACHSATGTATDTKRPSAEAQCRCCAVKAELERASVGKRVVLQGLPAHPAAEKIDIAADGTISGLF